MYSIYQIDSNGKEKIIGNVDITNDFLPYITKYLKQYVPLAKITYIDKYHGNCPDGFYLLNNGHDIRLIQNIKVRRVGYLYNISAVSTKILFTWRLIEHDDNKL